MIVKNEVEPTQDTEVGTIPIPGNKNSTIPPNFGIVMELPRNGIVELIPILEELSNLWQDAYPR